MPPNMALQRTRFAPLRSPLSRKPFGGLCVLNRVYLREKCQKVGRSAIRVFGTSRYPHLVGDGAGGSGVLEYRPTGWPAGSTTRPMAPVPSGRLKGNPGTTVPPSSFAFLQLAWISVTWT